MTLAIEYFDAAGNAAADGVFIPVADLLGVDSSELAAAETTASKEGKVMLALLNTIYSVASPESFPKLGFGIEKEAPSGVDADIFDQVFLITHQKLVNLDSDRLSVVPTPVDGANAGLGGFAITAIFAGAFRVNAGDFVDAGVIVNTSGLALYSSLAHEEIDPNADSRAWFFALADHLAVDSTKRSASVASAAVSGIASSLSASAIPADYIAVDDPISGILASEVPSRGLVNRTDVLTVQVQLNQSTQTFDVRVATA